MIWNEGITGIVKTEFGGKYVNEDYILAPKKDSSIPNYFVMADGVGSTANSELAAHAACHTVQKWIKKEMIKVKTWPIFELMLQEAINHANKKIIAINACTKYKGTSRASSTTIDICAFYGDHLYVGHVGDGRVYVFKKTGDLELITQDENAAWVNPEKGKLTPPEITKVHPLSKRLTNVLGASLKNSEIKRYPLNQIHAVFAATDGIYRCLTDEELKNTLYTLIADKNVTPKEILDDIFKKAKNPADIVPIFAEHNKVDEETARIMLKQDNQTAALYTIGREENGKKFD